VNIKGRYREIKEEVPLFGTTLYTSLHLLTSL